MSTRPSLHCLVTGANRGIGLEFTRQLLERGDRVTATCRHPGRATALNALAAEHPGRLHVLPLDITDAKSRAELVRELPLVGGDVDLLINNAGVLHSGERFGHLTAGNFEDSFRTNALGPLLLTQALAPHLAAGAKVVNLSSVLGSVGSVDGFHTPSYAVSKAALNMVTALLAQALAEQHLTVLAFHPGWVMTDMGGDGAQLPATDAVAAMLRVVDAATPADNGRFLNRRGEPMPW
ncbi:short-chain dehydrogenase [Lysobacter daejeonensis GH1-9]|uniref:Short-chain dehydrogenase n=1 Tax=Lysobacter daejeonensis GH1-9 TaxID=1385517 RepID=A0A0A0ESS7_9GAMM|nr:SDR family oxidoreductase [Lysobacter daejeonensis]KGM53188.1 short-chain dehydrogenase [Lysobacter daejeonensis GH1-9]